MQLHEKIKGEFTGMHPRDVAIEKYKRGMHLTTLQQKWVRDYIGCDEPDEDDVFDPGWPGYYGHS